MKIVVLNGSPRKNGTSTRIARAFSRKAEELGAQVEDYYLNGMHYRGCQSCNKCHEKFDHCILRDDLSEILIKMRTADVTVLSSPVYYGDLSGQLKMMFDRMFSNISYYGEGKLSTRVERDRVLLLVLAQGDVEEMHGDIIERYKDFIEEQFGFVFRYIRATELMSFKPDEDVSEYEAQAVELAKEIILQK